MDYFSNLPDEMVAKIFQFYLTGRKQRLQTYNRFHLVCRQWHAVCVDYAEHLPKSTEPFTLYFQDDGSFISRNIDTRFWIKCTNYDGLGNGPRLQTLLSHYDIAERMEALIFGAISSRHGISLLQLIENQLTRVKVLKFGQCNLSGVSEEDLTTFFAAVAFSKRCTTLECSSESFLPITDQSVAPLIANGVLRNVHLPMKSWNPNIGITDATLINLAENFSRQKFIYCFTSSNHKITALGVNQLIEAFCAPHCCVEESSFIIIPTQLKYELFKLRAPNPDNYQIIERGKQCFYRRHSSHPFRNAYLRVFFRGYNYCDCINLFGHALFA